MDGHFQNLSHQNMVLVKTDVFDVKQKVQKGTKRSSGPKTNLFDKSKKEKRTGWVNSEGGW